MKFFVVCVAVVSLLVLVGIGCSKADWQKRADAFLEKYLEEFARIDLELNSKFWQASCSGKKEDFSAYAAANLEMKKLHSDKRRYAEVQELLSRADDLKPLTRRSLQVAELDFKGNQLPDDVLEKLAKGSAEIEQVFNTFRGRLGGREYSNNELLDMLAKESDSAGRQEIWQALKQVGEAAAPKLIALAKERNRAAQKLGYLDYWDMQVRLQEHNPQQLLAIFSELETMTDEPFRQMKVKLDEEVAGRLNVKPEDLMPWHYDNPFFQAAPPSQTINLDDFYRDKQKEEIIKIGHKFFADVGLLTADIIARSDLYERKGKDQHAFSTDIDRKGDARILVNIKPTAEWMDTTLHELGHAVYSKYTDYSLPFNLRDAAHAFTTEGAAQLFGALAKNPGWLVKYGEADKKEVDKVGAAVLEQRRREQLIFARWSMVMLYFEKALYENPDQDLNKLWWDLKERFQLLKRPPGRGAADWAAKPHFTIAPVYYHNYMLGELLAAQLRAALVKLAKHDGPTYTLDYGAHEAFGDFFRETLFEPGMTYPWPEYVKITTGEPLTAKYFAEELK